MGILSRRAKVGSILSVVALVLGQAVRADIVPLFKAETPTANGCEFSYDASLANGSQVFTGDFFTIYDFNGYVAGSAFAPVDWNITVQNTGITPSGVDPSAFGGDNPNVINITFTYVGAPTIIGPSTIGGPGAFGAESTFCNTNGLGTYASNVHLYNPSNAQQNGTRQANGGYTVTPSAVPETSSLMLLAPGLVPIGIMLRRRTAKK